MNSLINTNNGDCHEHHRKCVDPCPPQYCEFKSHDDLHPIPGGALLEIGRTSAVIINAAIAPTITAAAPRLIAQVTLDPTGFCFPNLKIEFSSLINVTGVTAIGDNITIQLSRINYGYSATAVKEVLASYTINLPVIAAATTTVTVPFSFVYGEENLRLRESTYLVEVVAATLATADTGIVQIQDSNIAALAVGGVRVD
jgi:hypothetical protein